MTTNIDVRKVIDSFGRYRVGYAGAVQFNSIVFRLIAGVFEPKLLSYVAVVTGVEFLLNGLLEVPCGYVADTWGRIKCSIMGLFLFSASLVTDFLYLYLDWPGYEVILGVLAGAFLGIGKPLISGSAEGYYQDTIKSLSDGTSHSENLVNSSFLLSLARRSYMPILYVLTSFLLIATFQYYNISKFLFLIGAGLYIHLAFILLRDSRLYPEVIDKHNSVDILKTIGNLLRVGPLFGVVTNMFSMFILMFYLGYFIVFIGQEFAFNDHQMILVYLSLMGGYMGAGWMLRSKFGPTLKGVSFERLSLVLTSVLVIGVIIQSKLFSTDKFLVICITSFIFMTALQFIMGVMIDLSMNRILCSVERRSYATAISISNIPTFLLVGAYSTYLANQKNGILSLSENTAHVLISIGIYFLMAVPFAMSRK